MMAQELTEKQKRFCEEWMVDMNATQAAIRAGYSERTASEQSARLLGNVRVQAYISDLRGKLSQKLEISRERVLQEYARIAFSDPRALYHEDGKLKSIKDLDEDAAAALSGLEIEEIYADSMPIGNVKKIKRWDKVRALEGISKIMGYNAAEKHEFEAGQSFLDLLKQTSVSAQELPKNDKSKKSNKQPSRKGGPSRRKPGAK